MTSTIESIPSTRPSVASKQVSFGLERKKKELEGRPPHLSKVAWNHGTMLEPSDAMDAGLIPRMGMDATYPTEVMEPNGSGSDPRASVASDSTTGSMNSVVQEKRKHRIWLKLALLFSFPLVGMIVVGAILIRDQVLLVADVVFLGVNQEVVVHTVRCIEAMREESLVSLMYIEVCNCPCPT